MPDSILTPLQAQALRALFEAGIGDEGFYLTGGTGLAEFYLRHRLSDDLDLFSRREDLSESDLEACGSILRAAGLTITSHDIQPQYARFFVQHETSAEEPLKVEFCKDVECQLGPPETHGRVVVDSLLDICVNKVCAILERFPSEPKDFVDLYFIIEETDYSLDFLLAQGAQKEMSFEQDEGLLIFATNLLSVSQAKPLPRLLKPVTATELSDRLRPLAEEIINRLGPKRSS